MQQAKGIPALTNEERLNEYLEANLKGYIVAIVLPL